jgi:hypothetical protein
MNSYALSLCTPIILQYMTNATGLISKWFVMFEPTLLILSNLISSTYGLNLEKMMLDEIWCEIDKSDILQ